MEIALTKVELKQIMRRFIDNKKRGISLQDFCDIAGVDLRDFVKVFHQGILPLSERMQRRVSRAYNRHVEGKLVVFRNPDLSHTVTYRKEPKPRFARNNQIVFENGRFSVKCGIVNRLDHSRETLDEQLKRG